MSTLPDRLEFYKLNRYDLDFDGNNVSISKTPILRYDPDDVLREWYKGTVNINNDKDGLKYSLWTGGLY